MGKNVDTSIQGKATGSAAQEVERHSGEHPLKLYAGWFCPFVQRAWIVLVEKKIPYQYIEINPYNKDPDFLALNPRGLVPTLGVPTAQGKDLKPLYESSVICQYLDEAYADESKHGPALLPADPYERARCRLWMDHVATRIVPGFYKLIQHTPQKEFPIERAREELHGHVKTLVREMDSSGGGPWFAGGDFGMVDVMLAPWALRLWLIDHYKPGGFGAPKVGEGGDDEEIWARWRKWLDAVENRESIKATCSVREQYIDVYKRYADDTTNSLVAQATRQGKSLP
ncbi:uncharacterized protein E0L32_011599 [Thyridium curvatum]|uniref:Glutathione S-transferase n=1 Tax=Thyridium curvatum TaxID=1093900 RepID=A0A507BGK4_9PEZI|nr:uncharacterized protein E0L32_011599 [Thyridium curvatum]TPX18486.1 hypothetical protein E0L32_011599 [Thyridium curvatum]